MVLHKALLVSVSYPLGLSTCGSVLCPQDLCNAHYIGKLSCVVWVLWEVGNEARIPCSRPYYVSVSRSLIWGWTAFLQLCDREGKTAKCPRVRALCPWEQLEGKAFPTDLTIALPPWLKKKASSGKQEPEVQQWETHSWRDGSPGNCSLTASASPGTLCGVFVSLEFGDLLFIYLPTCLPVCSLSLYFDFFSIANKLSHSPDHTEQCIERKMPETLIPHHHHHYHGPSPLGTSYLSVPLLD